MDCFTANTEDVFFCSHPQVLLRWAVQQGVLVLPKSSNADRIQENVRLFDFTLSDTDMGKLSALDCGQRYCWDPTEVVWNTIFHDARCSTGVGNHLEHKLWPHTWWTKIQKQNWVCVTFWTFPVTWPQYSQPFPLSPANKNCLHICHFKNSTFFIISSFLICQWAGICSEQTQWIIVKNKANTFKSTLKIIYSGQHIAEFSQL